MRHFFAMLIAFLFVFFLGCSVQGVNDISHEPTEKSPTITRSSSGSSEVKTVLYVEVNNGLDVLLDVPRYIRKSDGKPFINIVNIFAANINYDVKNDRAIFYANENVYTALNNIDYLQSKGIKVLLTILGNRQGVGFDNFPYRAAAKDFAQQVASVVQKYNLDGIDLDNEYVEHGKNGTDQPNDSSFIMFLQELRKLLPNKIISLFNIAISEKYFQWNGYKANDYLDYIYNSSYSSYDDWFINSGLGFTKSQFSPAAIRLSRDSQKFTKQFLAERFAKRTVKEGYGVYMIFGLNTGGWSNYLSAISKKLYGEPIYKKRIGYNQYKINGYDVDTVNRNCIKRTPEIENQLKLFQAYKMNAQKDDPMMSIMSPIVDGIERAACDNSYY